MEFDVDYLINKLESRGVKISDMSILVFELQKKYMKDLTIEDCNNAILDVLKKREVAYTILTGISIDIAAEKGLMGDINEVITTDEPLYGLDEILALSIVNVHGSIALTNFGYLDKVKPGIIGELDRHGDDSTICHTYLDDIVCAIVSSAAGRLAHYSK